MDRAEIAWAAGLFEGEGTFIRQTRNGRTRIGFALATTDRDVLERFAAIVGVGAIHPTSRWAEMSTKPIYRWSATANKDVQRLTNLLMPWLGQRRRDALERAWAEYASQPEPLDHWRHGQTHCKRGHEFTEENTRVETSGSRRCRECDRLRFRKRNLVGDAA
jgi:hypothetical protein